jgi:hypothetical protein
VKNPVILKIGKKYIKKFKKFLDSGDTEPPNFKRKKYRILKAKTITFTKF